ncbi:MULTISPECIES: zinc ribbon domain-containing protein [Rickettsiales]|uniref:zinc ribbon domain-containing protein n=1 Tax=unclassified Wolbachia TaxID=2640676 RepID=UPI0020A1750F|nr:MULTISPECIES: zinc ribbon domain-containing protein [Rickettsiales]MBV2145948.1 zinc ribbon domain-containing protein [Wolbachia endosymbiont of Pissodes strobi]WMT83924.1 zinc ribbon domain-containing protein [Wolbachia endosymbiont of Listronotus oregonensis]
MQGLVVCKLCNYAYYGTSTARNKEGKKLIIRCIIVVLARRFGGNKMCNNKLIRTDTLDIAVWEEVKHLLKNPNRILEEYKRRLSELTTRSKKRFA